MVSSSSSSRQPLYWLGAALSLLVSLYGLANVMPAIGDIRLGPFPMVFFRATFFALCILVVMLSMLDRYREGRTPGWLAVIGVCLSLFMIWSCWSFYEVSILQDQAMFLFGPKQAWIALICAAGELFFCWRIWGAPVALLGIFGIL